MKPAARSYVTILLVISFAVLSQSVFVSTVKAGEMSYEERLEMKKKVQKQIERGETPAVKPGMSFEERLYIKKKQQDQQKERAPQGPPPPQAQQPRPRPEPSDRHRPDYRPRDRYDDRPSVIHRPPPVYHHDDNDWRKRRCWEIWGGRGHQFNRCLDGDREYLYPRPRYERETRVYIDASPPPVIYYRQPEWPANLLAERYPIWYAPEVNAEGIISAKDGYRNYRSFHLVGIRPGEDASFTASCIARNLTDSRVQINEVASYSNYSGADAEAVVFTGKTVLNLQILAEGCAEFDADACADLDLDICRTFQDAEDSARRNRLGVWR